VEPFVYKLNNEPELLLEVIKRMLNNKDSLYAIDLDEYSGVSAITFNQQDALKILGIMKEGVL
jgi:hypothetical protein